MLLVQIENTTLVLFLHFCLYLRQSFGLALLCTYFLYSCLFSIIWIFREGGKSNFNDNKTPYILCLQAAQNVFRRIFWEEKSREAFLAETIHRIVQKCTVEVSQFEIRAFQLEYFWKKASKRVKIY